MKRKAVLGIMLTLLFIGILSLTFDIQPVKAFTISSDYTFTSNIYESIVVTADNIIIDGAGYTVQGTGSGTGIDLSYRSNVTLKNVEVTNFFFGIYLHDSSNNTISGNNIANNWDGITLEFSSDNRICGNNIANKYGGIGGHSSSNYNSIIGNNIANNEYGISLIDSSGYTIYHNNFINNTNHVATFRNSTWDDGYPSGGNYWSNYAGVDANMDGIGDSSYEIDSNNIDHYPLMGTFSDFPVTIGEETCHVTTICNSTISAFEFDQVNGIIRFNVTGEEGIGFCRVCIPHDLMEPPYTVTVDEYAPLYINYTLYDNGTHRWIYFTYQHSTQEVIIIPEFPSFLILPLFMAATLLAVTIIRKKHKANLRVPA